MDTKQNKKEVNKLKTFKMDVHEVRIAKHEGWI
jgi:hypothetical protein